MTSLLPLETSSMPELPEAERGFGALVAQSGAALPLRAFTADIEVDGLSTRWRISQEFLNSGHDVIEAVYIFPLPPRAAVTAFRVVLGGRTISGELKERGQARADYQQALASSQRAALLEEDRPNVFTVQVGNIPPGERVAVHIELAGLVAVEAGEATVRLPLVVAPRYIPGAPLGEQAGVGTAPDTALVPDASRISPPVLLPGFPNPVQLAISVAVAAAVPVSALRCSLPASEEAPAADGRRSVRLVPGQRLDRDFILRWTLGTGEVAGGALGTAHGGASTIAITVVPPIASGAIRPRDVVVVLDRSGSMQGWKMVAARRAAARLVDSLGPADRFAVVAFDYQPEVPGINQAGLSAGSDRNRFAAVGFLGAIEARGGTEFEPAFARCFALLGDPERDRSRERVVVLVTDGQIGNEDHLLRRFAAELASVRLIALGIDQAVNEAVLMRLATPGGGWWACVESEDWLDAVLREANRQVQPPVLTDLSIVLPGSGVAEFAPHTPPDVAPGTAVQVLARVVGRPESVRVQARRADGSSWSQELAVRYLPDSSLPKAWGRARVRDLEDRYAVTSDAAIEAQLVALSLSEGVLCRFTAFVAVDQRRVEGGGAPRTVVQAVETVSGWAPSADPVDFNDAVAGGAMSQSQAGPSMAEFEVPSAVGPVPQPRAAVSMAAAPPPAPAPAAKPKPGDHRGVGGGAGIVRRSRGQAPAPPSEPLPPAQQPPIAPLDLLLSVLIRWKDAGNDAIRRALVLRSSAVLQALARLAEHLAGQPADQVLAERLQDLLQRIQPPRSLAEVRGCVPDAERLLADLEQVIVPRTHGSKNDGAGRRFWT